MHDDPMEKRRDSSSEGAKYVERYMIEIRRPGEKLDVQSLKRLLDGTGVELDPSYGPFLVNPGEGRYVVRGIVSPEAKKKLEAKEGVTLFRDKRVIRTI